MPYPAATTLLPGEAPGAARSCAAADGAISCIDAADRVDAALTALRGLVDGALHRADCGRARICDADDLASVRAHLTSVEKAAQMAVERAEGLR